MNIIKSVTGAFKNLQDEYIKIFYTIVCIIFFSVVYMIFDNEEFGGWLDTKYPHYVTNDKKRISIFYEYTNKNESSLTREEFLSLPIVNIDDRLYLVKDDNSSNKYIPIKELLFKLYNVDGNIPLDTYLKMPVSAKYYNKPLSDIPVNIYTPGRSPVENWFDRLYYSTITQSSIGFGDIFGASKRVRFVTLIQALSTIFIILL